VCYGNARTHITWFLTSSVNSSEYLWCAYVITGIGGRFFCVCACALGVHIVMPNHVIMFPRQMNGGVCSIDFTDCVPMKSSVGEIIACKHLGAI
jgi:hypothetical protein